jgi:hypothetical protein
VLLFCDPCKQPHRFIGREVEAIVYALQDHASRWYPDEGDSSSNTSRVFSRICLNKVLEQAHGRYYAFVEEMMERREECLKQGPSKGTNEGQW